MICVASYKPGNIVTTGAELILVHSTHTCAQFELQHFAAVFSYAVQEKQ